MAAPWHPRPRAGAPAASLQPTACRRSSLHAPPPHKRVSLLDYFGPEIQLRVRRAIWERHHGELLVGAAVAVETGDARIPYLMAAPTMSVPMVLRESVNPYLAARAVFLLLQNGTVPEGGHRGQPLGERIRTVAVPGLGTSVGRVGPNPYARQVCQALDDVVLGLPAMPRSWTEASERL